MRKIISLIAVCVITIGFASAEITGSRFKITESEKEFDVMYYLSKDMKVIEPLENNDVNVTQSFSIEKNGQKGEVRYPLFTDCGGDDDKVKMQYAMWVLLCINNATGYQVQSNAVKSFTDSDVKKEFNGDFGNSIFVQNPVSDYGKGFKYMMMEFFYKSNQGIVMRTFLFNDIAFVGMNQDGSLSDDSPLFSNYHTFRFMEKNEKGEFVSESGK